MNNQRSKFIAFINALPEEELIEIVHLGKLVGYNPNESDRCDGYNPEKAYLDEDTLATFLRAPITGVLTEVPGIGPKTAKQLSKGTEPIVNTLQLLGKYLMLKSNDQETNESIDCSHHCDKFWHWLKAKGVDIHRSGIVQAIAEMADAMIPGMYNEDDFN
jgi:5'-3' exonuclease